MAIDPSATPRPLRLVSRPRDKPPSRGRRGAADPPRIELQRARKLVTAAEAVRKFPFAGLTGGAGVSREVVEDHLEGVEACLLAAFEQTLALAADRATAAFEAQEGWLDRVRAGLMALLEFFDQQPALAKFLVVHSAQAGPAVQARRGAVLDRFASVLDDETAPARGYPPPLTGQAVASGALGVLHQRLSNPDTGPLVELTGPLMSFIVLPFLGARAARSELRRPVEASRGLADGVSLDVLQDPGGGVEHHLTVRVLRILVAEPGLSNSDLARRVGIADARQISRDLARAARQGLIRNTRDAAGSASTNSWRPTASGEEFLAAVTREAAEAASMAFEVPEEFGGRMEHRAVAVLRVIVDQPWLYTSEIALRAGVDPTEIPTVLGDLRGLGVVDGVRDVHFKGSPKAWLPTASGERLDRAIGRESPRPPRSLALQLMWESGGRLSVDAVAVLRVICAEPDLSNNDIALQVGISDENTASKLLALLARRELSENARTGGRYNVWRPTPAGEDLDSAIRKETPASVTHRMALELFRRGGGRLNHRVVEVLQVIAAEPDVSNDEIALRVGIASKGTVSTLLTRLAGFGLIRNTRTKGRHNAWRLTVTGRDLEAAIRHGARLPGAERSTGPQDTGKPRSLGVVARAWRPTFQGQR
jgi:predicted transcriptional regulator/AcrR family transcriptional regulator